MMDAMTGVIESPGVTKASSLRINVYKMQAEPLMTSVRNQPLVMRLFLCIV